MARLDAASDRPLPLHTNRSGKVCNGNVDEEKRAPAPVDEDEYNADACASDQVDDDKSVAVLARNELEPFDRSSDHELLERLTTAMQDLREQDDWLAQHEATVVLRRIVVHHAHIVTAQHVESFLDHVVLGCDNLRSALSKNSLLALAECFETLGATFGPTFVRHRALLDVLLRRASCEKQFLRDAAAFAVQQLATHVASLELITRACAHAKTKHSRLCGNAARIVSSSLVHLEQRERGAIVNLADSDNGAPMRLVCVGLAGFYSAKDKRARLEATAAFRAVGDALGAERFDRIVKSALSDALAARRIVNDVFPPPPDAAAACSKSRRGSLRERMLLDAAS